MMSVPMFMNSKDVASFRGCSLSDARYLILMFERTGLMQSDRKRNKLVDIHIFAKWYADYTRQNYKAVLIEVKEWMRERYATAG